MRPIKNIFNFECYKCEYNRNCYGGNMGNQFKYCQKSTEKMEELEQLPQEIQQLKDELENYKKLEDNWNKLKEYAKDNLYFYDGYQGEDLETDFAIQGVLNKMWELERGVSDE